MNLRKERERRAPRRFENELDQIYAPEYPERQVIRPATRPAHPIFYVEPKPFRTNLPPAAFPSLPMDNNQAEHERGGHQEGANAEGEDYATIGLNTPASGGPDSQGDGNHHEDVQDLRDHSLSPMSPRWMREDSLIVRLILDKDTEDENNISLRKLINRVDAIEATVWFAKPQMRSIQGFNDINTLLKYRLSHSECLEEQYSVDSTLAAMQSSDDESRGLVHISTEIPKVDFSSLKPILRYTIIANMYTAALQEGFQDPFFPVQRLLDVSAKGILHALSAIEKTCLDGFYLDSIASQAMAGHILHARRFLIQQDWPRRFLKPVNVPRYEIDPDVEIQAPHAPLGSAGLPATHLDFFGRLAEVNCKELNEVFFGARDGVARDARNEALNRIWTPRRVRRTLSGLRGSQEQQLPRSRLRLGRMAFTAGAAQAELQRVRHGDREERAEQGPVTPPRQVQQTYGAPATLEKHHAPDFVNSPPVLPTGNYSAFGVHTRENNAPNYSPSRPRFRFRRHSSPQQMALPARITPPSKQPDPPSMVYGQQPSLEESESAVLTMMGAASSRAVSSNDASPPKKKKKDTPTDTATPDQQQPRPLATRSPNLPPAPRLPPAPKPSPATTTTQHDDHHHRFETAYHRQIQEQQAAQALSSLRRSASTAAARPPDFHAHPSSSSPDAVPPAPPSTPAGAAHPSVSGRGVAVAPPRVVPTAPMTTERTVRAHFAFPDRSNVRLPSFGAERRGGSVAVESAGTSAGGGGGGRLDPFEAFMAGVMEQARDGGEGLVGGAGVGGEDGENGGRGGDGGAVG